ncbi:basic salivary proline-rich protein 1-like [Dorcoceras hygrometricum]|uniref:Basic salivary proline-rich protein 1-like n=1 Tax=Dorcoceras hygrometricum TaxID=472368 RepID=A0A2Z7CHK5_9LAMI|nr:basic salivary proline-rich protein 1-like [Dorcoceras hygrometricum]
MASHPTTTDLNVPEAAPAAAPASDPEPVLPVVDNHPHYSQLITDAIASLNERDGSSKRAISKHIEAHHPNLPPAHSSLLTAHLKLLRDGGRILMVKKSYKLASSPPEPPVSVNEADDSVGQKKRRGRPPKRKSVQDAVPVFGEQSINGNPVSDTTPQMQNAASGPLGSVNVDVGAPVVGGTSGGRGRRPKQGGVKRGRGRPKLSGAVQSTVGRSKGRPKKNDAPVITGTGRRRGRQRKGANLDGGVAAVDSATMGSVAVVVGTGDASTVPGNGLSQVGGKRRGRPPKSGNDVKRVRKVATGGASNVAGGKLSQVARKRRGRPPKEIAAGNEVKKPRKLSGKPLGRPKKNASAEGSQTPVDPQQINSLDLRGKLQYVQSRIKQTVSIIKPHLNSETASNALQELETLAEMDVNTLLNIPPQS